MCGENPKKSGDPSVFDYVLFVMAAFSFWGVFVIRE
jgi:hypothetical protein